MAQSQAKAKRLKGNTEIINYLIGQYDVAHIWYTPYHVRIWAGKGVMDIYPVNQKVNTTVGNKRAHYNFVTNIEITLETWLKEQKKQDES